MKRLLIDTDAVVDGAHAIMLAFAHAEVHIEAITTLAGAVSLEQATANACIILDVLERDVPVYAGCGRALVQFDTPDVSFVLGRDGLGGSGYPPQRRVADEHAVHALVRLANEGPGDLTLAATGPLTDLALATRLDPAFPTKYKRLVVMGGTIRAAGITPPVAQFDSYADPQAVAIVSDAWRGPALISWKATLDHCLAREQVEALMGVDSPRAEFFQRISRGMIEFNCQFFGCPLLPEPDALAVAVAVEPEIVREAKAPYVRSSRPGIIHAATPRWTGMA